MEFAVGAFIMFLININTEIKYELMDFQFLHQDRNGCHGQIYFKQTPENFEEDDYFLSYNGIEKATKIEGMKLSEAPSPFYKWEGTLLTNYLKSLS
jgi:hypothetical protein